MYRLRCAWQRLFNVEMSVRIPSDATHLRKRVGIRSKVSARSAPSIRSVSSTGYLSQPFALQRAKAQIVALPRLFLNPQYAEVVEQILEQVDETERFCIIDQVHAYKLFLGCNVSKSILEEWSVNWQGSALGNFARALLNALEIKGPPDGNFVKRVRAVVQAFQQQEEALIRQMRQVNVQGKVVASGVVDTDTGKVLARFTIEFEGGASAYIPFGY